MEAATDDVGGRTCGTPLAGDSMHPGSMCSTGGVLATSKENSGLRSELFQEIGNIETGFMLMSSTDKCISLLTSKNTNVLTHLAKYIYRV